MIRVRLYESLEPQLEPAGLGGGGSAVGAVITLPGEDTELCGPEPTVPVVDAAFVPFVLEQADSDATEAAARHAKMSFFIKVKALSILSRYKDKLRQRLVICHGV